MVDATTGLGKIITTNDKGRDAVHVAVAPMTADEKLFPGQWCNIVRDRARMSPDGKGAGIVDPFLTAPVQPDQRFWLWMLPGSITSLRHEWTHPALDGPPPTPKEAAARASIAALAGQLGLTYDATIDAARHFMHGGERKCDWGFESVPQPDDFWTNFEIVTGEKVSEDVQGDVFFTCGGCS